MIRLPVPFAPGVLIRAKFFRLCAEFITNAFLYAIVFLTTQVVLWGSYNTNAVQGYDSRRNAQKEGDSNEDVSCFYHLIAGSGKSMTRLLRHWRMRCALPEPDGKERRTPAPVICKKSLEESIMKKSARKSLLLF